MIDSDLEDLLIDPESDRVERKESISDAGKIRQAICAFANDMPNHQKLGVIFVGVDRQGNGVNLAITGQVSVKGGHLCVSQKGSPCVKNTLTWETDL